MPLKTIIKRYIILSVSLLFFMLILGQIIKPEEFMKFFSHVFFKNGGVVSGKNHIISGEFKAVSFIKFFVIVILLLFNLIFFDIVYSFFRDAKKEKKKNIIELQSRVKKILNNDHVEECDEYLEIDNLIRASLTEKQSYKEEFEKSMTQLNLSMAFLAHDLRTPLTSILGYTELLHDNKNLNKETQDKYIDIIRGKSFVLEELIDQFFIYTKTQLQTKKVVKSEFNLYEFMIQVKETFYPYTIEKNVDIKMEIPEEKTILGDPNEIARCFNNILKNAILNTDNGKEIYIKYEETADFDLIIFENLIKENEHIDVENIFQLFYRGDYSRSRDVKGSGLGLNIAKTIVENHQGKIEAALNGNLINIIVKLPKE